jgi:hypothetical protein
MIFFGHRRPTSASPVVGATWAAGQQQDLAAGDDQRRSVERSSPIVPARFLPPGHVGSESRSAGRGPRRHNPRAGAGGTATAAGIALAWQRRAGRRAELGRGSSWWGASWRGLGRANTTPSGRRRHRRDSGEDCVCASAASGPSGRIRERGWRGGDRVSAAWPRQHNIREGDGGTARGGGSCIVAVTGSGPASGIWERAGADRAVSTPSPSGG